MTADSLSLVFYGTIALTTLALAAFIAIVSVWAVSFFARNRTVRHQRGESIPTYYRHKVVQPHRHSVLSH